ncbi:MAG: CehA/McbA family metallohydrolase [Pseudomonadota bacterium]
MLTAFQADGRFWKGNLHGHSTRSDGALDPEEVCRRYRDAGYDFTAITDHFRAVFDFPIVDTTAYRETGFTTLIGAEVHAPATSWGDDWHILAVGLPLDFAPTDAAETGPALARRCRAAGAFVAIAHPQWYSLTLADAQSLDAAHAIEIYNHSSRLTFDRGDGSALLDTLLSRGREIGVIATDDSHWIQMDGFGGWVMVKAPENTPAALLSALKAGAYYASEGPEILDIQRKGDGLEVCTSPAANILALGPGAKAVLELGTELTTARLSLEPFRGSWCRVVVIDAAGRRAWSNPLWPDA